MKKTFLLLFINTLCILMIYGQKNSGLVIYQQKINMHKRMTDENIKAMVPEFRTILNQLQFNQTASIFKNYEAADEDESMTEDNNGGVMIMIKTPESVVYKNYEKKSSVELRELAGKNFLIQDSIRHTSWKINPGTTKKINGYECMQATGSQKSKMIKMNISDDRNGKKESKDMSPAADDIVIAWFAPDIPVPAGPSNFGGLPGLILEVNINDGEAIFSVQKLELKDISTKDIKEPSGGKKVTPTEFNKIQDDYFKEMDHGGGGMRIIRN